MSKIRNISDLKITRDEFNQTQKKYRHVVMVCSGAGCISSGSPAVVQALREEIEKTGLKEKVKINMTGCMGTCDVGPAMIVDPGGVFYCNLNPEDVQEIVDSHLIKNEIAQRLCYTEKKTKEKVPYAKDIDFFKNQFKIVLKNCGRIDYDSLEEYIAHDGYFALAKALEEMSPREVIDEVRKSGLRGRGGGGFPTGLKWSFAAKSNSKEKYIICNADEGDPGAFMDRSLLEGDPHIVIEGMLIAGYAIGAQKGFIYVRAEYPIAVDRLRAALEHAYDKGLLGKNILGKGLDFDIEIRIGAGAFVCGEETSLMASVEGKRGEPSQKPPYPTDSGLFGKPTVINNVETFGNISSIILNGSGWFAGKGTEKSRGTKVFALAGDVNNTGIIEVPMGITLGEIIFDIGGGIPNGKKFKVAQTGGPSGGCLTARHLNTPIDYDSLVELGAIMGSGGLICMDEDTCMVDVARYFMEFVQEESCGKCLACRLGTKRMLEILERITTGKGRDGDIEALMELGNTIKDTAMCGLGQTAANPVLSTIQYFRNEYEEHIRDKHCRAGVCSELFLSPCENACPAGVNVPGYISLIASGRPREAYHLIRQENPFPAVCARVCTHPCEERCRRGQLDEPVAIKDLKRYVSDEAMKEDVPYQDTVFPRKGKSIGIIGAGPSGLTCGYYLARLGYEVVVYEAQPVSGGMLAYAIPEYRLPKKVLNFEIDKIRNVGVKIKNNMTVGKEILFDEIRKKHDAVYIATGTQISRKVDIPGENLKGIYHGLDFLRDVNLGRQVEVKGKVGVIGGGSTAFDAARVALRLGAEEVHVFYRRDIEDMPADRREIEEAMEEGIRIHTLACPDEFVGRESAEKLICSGMELKGFDRDGRKNPVRIENSRYEVELDLIIPAVSQYSDLPFVRKEEVEVTKWGTFIVDENMKITAMDKVFAGGDVVRGSDVVITAIADGKKAAVCMDRFLGGEGILNKGSAINIPDVHDDGELVEHERFACKYLDPDKRKDNFNEVAMGYHKLNAIAESMRCLHCDRKSL